MKKIILCSIGILLLAHCQLFSQQSVKEKKPEEQIKQYWFVLLKKGNNRTQDSVAAAKLQEGHMANINRLYYEGKLKVAGPFGDEGDWRGIFIFDVETKEEVEILLKTDPAIAAGRLTYEIHSWWTAAMGSFKPGKPEKN
jgi:uncharacterized protein YciI